MKLRKWTKCLKINKAGHYIKTIKTEAAVTPGEIIIIPGMIIISYQNTKIINYNQLYWYHKKISRRTPYAIICTNSKYPQQRGAL